MIPAKTGRTNALPVTFGNSRRSRLALIPKRARSVLHFVQGRLHGLRLETVIILLFEAQVLRSRHRQLDGRAHAGLDFAHRTFEGLRGLDLGFILF